MYQNSTRMIQALLTSGMIVASGCDDRALQISSEAANRQAQQNTAMAALNTEVASGTQRLVAADSASRQGFVEVHRDLLAERRLLVAGWNSLEAERKQLASQRQIESAWVPLARACGGCVLAIVLLSYCWLVISSAGRNETSDALLHALLVDELLSPDESPLPTRPLQLDEQSTTKDLTR